LDQQLSDVESLEFEKLLMEEPVWGLKVTEVRSLRDGVERHLLQENLAQIHQEVYGEPKKEATRQVFWPWLAAAAVVIFIIAGINVFGLLKSPSERLFEAYYEVDPGLITAMSGSDQYEFDRGMVDYKSGKYQEALAFWSPLLEESSQDTLLYFVAMAEIEVGEFEKAEDKLLQLTQLGDSEFVSDATWNLALLYLRKGEIEKSRTYLETSQNPSAAELLKKLE